MEIPAELAAQRALTQQNVTLSVIKQSAETQKAIAGILEQSAEALAEYGRGSNVNIRA
jgi:hypothetical protein